MSVISDFSLAKLKFKYHQTQNERAYPVLILTIIKILVVGLYSLVVYTGEYFISHWGG